MTLSLVFRDFLCLNFQFKVKFTCKQSVAVDHNFSRYLYLFLFTNAETCRYADFLSRLNDDRNVRALFERALSSLPPEESVEVIYIL